MSRTRHVFAVALAAALALGTAASADQLICVAADDFIADMSDLVPIEGNQWQEIADADGLRPVSMVAPGPGATDGAVDRPWLVYMLPVDVLPGESTADGKTWQIWHHLRVVTDSNSFYWQLSADGATWLPDPITNANRVNDDSQNDLDQWWWLDQLTGNDGAVDPVLSVGANYLRVGSRETKPEAELSPRFDIVCLRNYGELGAGNGPADDEVLAFLAAQSSAVEPRHKLATTWSELKSQ
jgi:hypothetical protein